jgi:hypothetical protein
MWRVSAGPRLAVSVDWRVPAGFRRAQGQPQRASRRVVLAAVSHVEPMGGGLLSWRKLAAFSEQIQPTCAS